MTVEQIPSDELIEMTELFHRAFNAAGCNPACHCCDKLIHIGNTFKLATIPKREVTYTSYPKNIQYCIDSYDTTKETKEVMLCDICTAKSFIEKDIKKLKEGKKIAENRPNSMNGCFRINGKIIH